jgi:hypothetical protein
VPLSVRSSRGFWPGAYDAYPRRKATSALEVVVARSSKLDQIEAVPEWVSHVSHASVFTDLYFTVERSPEAAESGNHLVEISHDKINVYGCPMPREMARHL